MAFKVSSVHAHDNIQFLRPLGDHADVDAVFTQLAEDLAGRTGLERHLPAHGRHDGHAVGKVQAVGLYLLLQVAHGLIQIR